MITTHTTNHLLLGYKNLHLVQSLQQHTVFTSCAFFVYLKSPHHLVIILINNKNTKLLYLDPESKLRRRDVR